MNDKLGLDPAFLDKKNPFELFKLWMQEAEKSEPNDPNAVNVATVDSSGQPDNRMVLLKGLTENSFIFYTNLESKKSRDLRNNPKVSMCFHWKSLLRQVRVQGSAQLVDSKTADEYYNSRPYESRIGAWASSQSEVMKHRDEFEKKINEFKKKYPDQNNVPRPTYWSGWALTPYKIEFWKDVKNRLHQRLCYSRIGQAWSKEILYP
ncbi:MAG: pyridoxamine 5'-phosphate oxidase [Pelagibacteraceae bacterium]|nr:pyridoxamine 5'-phosphate oxidase [Pelagibacteraceae bacterium]